MIKRFYISSLLPSFLVTLSLVGCQSDYLPEKEFMELPEDAGINFTAAVLENTGEVETRALTQDPVPVNFDDYDMNFYIEMTAQISEQPQKELSTYIVPSGFEGQLQYKVGCSQNKLNWWGVDEMHYFWSWTVPWAEIVTEPEIPEPGVDPDPDGIDDDSGNDNESVNPDFNIPNTEFNPQNPTTDPLTFSLIDTHLLTRVIPGYEDENGEIVPDSTYRYLSEWQNGAILEKFIGTKSGPYNFRENGKYVPLQFRHLVSRIVIDGIEFLGADGSTHNDFPAEITFVNMPTTFTFYPHPTQNQVDENPGSLMTVDGPPIAITDTQSANPDGGLMFTALVRPDPYPRDMFYICPELDFTNIEFFVDIKDPDNKYNTRGTYWGDFKNVTFERIGLDGNPVPDYNNPNGGDSRILHAGEEMHFNIVVQQYGGGGTSQWIRGWGNGTVYNAGHHTHPGIYERGEAAEFLNKSGSQKDIFELYGEGNTNDLWPDCPEYQKNRGIFRLYGDVGVFERMSFPVDNGYIIDGMGYTITLRRTGTSSNISLGMMRDVYIQMENGIKMYVDKEGNVYVLNDEGRYIETSYILNANSTSINIDELAKLV